MEWELAVYPNVLILIWQERRRKEKKEKQKERSWLWTMSNLDHWLAQICFPSFSSSGPANAGRRHAPWDGPRVVNSGWGGCCREGLGEKEQHLSITGFLSEFDKTQPQTKWLGSSLFHPLKTDFFPLWPLEPPLKGKLFPSWKMRFSWPLSLSLNIVYHGWYEKITQIRSYLKWSHGIWKMCKTNSTCSKPWLLNSQLVFFLLLKGVFINSYREKLLNPLLKFYGTILTVFSFTNMVSIDNKWTTDNCQRLKLKAAVGIELLPSICCRGVSSG